ncbi:MAG: lipopolysaccharide transport periplasmic protein LptA [Rhodobacteraceae bacterium]|nr:lipopolysaccharide transport periplasmic protein LptA [Paracoccaceae bacterium]
MRPRFFRFLLAVSLIAPIAAAAQTTGVQLGGFTNPNPDAPVEITSKRLDLSRAAGTALFTGDVVAIQGEMRLNAQWVLVEYVMLPDGTVGQDIDTITARDKVLLVTPTEAAEGDEAIYHPLTNDVVMTGNVLLTQGTNTVAGDKMTVDLETGMGQVEGRVRTILQPGSEKKKTP